MEESKVSLLTLFELFCSSIPQSIRHSNFFLGLLNWSQCFTHSHNTSSLILNKIQTMTVLPSRRSGRWETPAPWDPEYKKYIAANALQKVREYKIRHFYSDCCFGSYGFQTLYSPFDVLCCHVFASYLKGRQDYCA
jgi:hypothetical protein